MASSDRRRVVVAILASAALCAFGCGSKSPPSSELEEISANFDPGNVEPFLVAVSGHVESGFNAEDARALSREINALALDTELIRELTVVCDGHTVPLRIQGVMDDTQAPDLYLFTAEPLAAKIHAELIALLEVKLPAGSRRFAARGGGCEQPVLPGEVP